MNQQNVENLIKNLLGELGEDISRPGLQKTPARVSKTYAETLSGYSRSLENEITVFPNEYGYTDIVYSGKISYFSTCEHHLLPFFGTAHIAYIPKDKIVGLSKLARAVDIFARRLQEQERITVQVADELMRLLDARGVAVMLEGQHFCSMSRGVQQADFKVKTFSFKGDFKNDDMKDRFLKMISLPE